MTKCPCKDCICIPICRNRNIDSLSYKCSLLDEFIEANSRRYKPAGIRLTLASALIEIDKIFKWGDYENTM